jgi:hypothetical protein
VIVRVLVFGRARSYLSPSCALRRRAHSKDGSIAEAQCAARAQGDAGQERRCVNVRAVVCMCVVGFFPARRGEEGIARGAKIEASRRPKTGRGARALVVAAKEAAQRVG